MRTYPWVKRVLHEARQDAIEHRQSRAAVSHAERRGAERLHDQRGQTRAERPSQPTDRFPLDVLQKKTFDEPPHRGYNFTLYIVKISE